MGVEFGVNMDYLRIYNEIIASSIDRDIDGYTENHHIIPICIGGTDDRCNMARLTAREHFIAHWLLARHYKSRELIFAWNCMCRNRGAARYTSRSFEYARRAWSKKMSEMNTGIKFSDERIKNLSESHLGQAAWNKGVKTGHQKAYLDRVNAYLENPVVCTGCGDAIPYEKRFSNPKYCSNKCAHEHNRVALKAARDAAGYKANSGSFKKGMIVSDEVARKISSKLTGLKRPTGECPHCGKIGAISLLKRWHYDNCKVVKDANC